MAGKRGGAGGACPGGARRWCRPGSSPTPREPWRSAAPRTGPTSPAGGRQLALSAHTVITHCQLTLARHSVSPVSSALVWRPTSHCSPLVRLKHWPWPHRYSLPWRSPPRLQGGERGEGRGERGKGPPGVSVRADDHLPPRALGADGHAQPLVVPNLNKEIVYISESNI
jgi:hypothetical protein